MADNLTLPEGFVLDKPETAPSEPVTDPLPQGFVLDEPAPTPDIAVETIAEPAEFVPDDITRYGETYIKDFGLKPLTPKKPYNWKDIEQDIPEDMKKYGARVKNSLSISATYNIPPNEAFVMESGFTERLGEPNLYDKALASFETGIGDVYVSMGSTMKWMGFSEEASDVYTNFGENLRQAYIPPTQPHEFEWSDMVDPEWWATSGARGVPFTLSLIPASIIGAYGGTATATAVGLGRTGQLIMGAIGASALSRPMESAFEAGGAREEAIAMGRTPEEAQEIGKKVFFDNMALIGVDAGQLALSFAPFARVGGKAMKDVMAMRVASVTGRLGVVGATEGAEERYQTKLTLDALGKETDFFSSSPELNEATALGGIFGAGMAGAGSVWTALRGEIVETMPDDLKQEFDELKKELVASGQDEATADLGALDAVADTEEGETHITETVESLKERAEAIRKSVEVAQDVIAKSEGQAEAEIIEKITTQLEATGMDRETATLQANVLFGEPFKVLAKRAGLTSEELLEQYAPEIGRGEIKDKDGEEFFQDKFPVEQKDLFVGHNLTASNIDHADKMGGLPVPSLAISRAGTGGYEGFGDITLLADKSLIDPRASRASKVFNADIYSPRYPEVESKISNKEYRKAVSFLGDSGKALGGMFYEINEEELARKGVNALMDATIVQHAFLDSIGKAPKIKYEKKLSPSGVKVLDNLGKTRRQINKRINDNWGEFENWVVDNFSDVFEGERIFKGFTSAGRRQYLPHDLDTVVKILKKGLRDGENFDYGVGSIRSTVAKQFKSIKQIQEAREDIVSRDDVDKLKDEVNDEFFELSNELNPYYRFDKESFGYSTAVSDAFKGFSTKGLSEFNEYFENVPDELMGKVGDFLQKLANMPTEYFEAKIQRAVGLDEFQIAVVPNDTRKETIAKLEKQGLEIVRYDDTKEGARAKVIGEQERVLFQAQKAKTLSEFVRSEGGLSEVTGDTERFKEGKLINKNGKTVDEMAESAWEAGYFTERPTEAEFLDLLDQDVASGSVYSVQDADAGLEAEVQKQEESLDPRARIRLGDKGVFIDLFKDADPSSIIHETGHLYLEILKDLAGREGMSADLVNDYATVRDWLGIKEGRATTTEQHEKWARGFEAYLREGKAPTAKLRQAFARFKEWLIAVYKTVDELNVELSPEIRSVMDRLLASQEDLAYIITEADNALVDLVTEGKGVTSITDEDISKIIADYKPKGITGIKKVYESIKADVSLNAEWKETQEVARVAFKAGKEEATLKAKAKMQEIIRKAKFKTAKKIDKIQTEKQKMAKRRRTIKVITDYLNLTESQIKKLTKRRNFSLMSDYEFKVFKDAMLIEAEQMQTTALEKARVMEVIERKRLRKVENYQKALGLPAIHKMTDKQLREYAGALEQFEEGDIFLGQRQIETVDNTDLVGVRTWRQAKEALAKEVSKQEGREVTVEELSNVVPPNVVDKMTYDSALVERDPFFRMLVTETTRAIFNSEVVAHKIENELQVLTKASEKSRGFSLTRKLVPQDKQIMDYLEAPVEDKGGIAEDMTPEQLDLAHFMNEYFGEALEYLVQSNTMAQGRENYMVHMRRSVIEDIKESGFKKALSNLFKNYEQDEMVFNILDGKTGEVLPLNKHFQYAMRRTGNLEPTFNVTKAFTVYMRTLEKKKALDALMPKMDIYSQAVAPVGKTEKGLELDPRIKQFVYTYINNKKGRRVSFDSTIQQGGRIDLGIMFLRTFTAMMDLGLNIYTGTASLVGEASGNLAMLGAEKMVQGELRTHTKKGKAFVKKYEAFTKRSFWQEFTLEGKDVTERFVEALFGLFHANTVKMNKQFLLGSITDEEYNSGELSEERLTELRLEMGRFRVVPNQKSILGSTSLGGAVTQYKTWAVPMATTTVKDLQKMATDLQNKPTGEALTSREAREVYRIILLTSTILMAWELGDEEDEGFAGKMKSKIRRESLSTMQSLDPTLWLSAPRTATFLFDLGQNVKALLMLEEYKTREGLKGVEGLKRQVTPAVVRQLSE